MPDPTIRRDALDLTGCTDAEHAAILSAGWLWVETLPADNGTTHGVFVRVVDASTATTPVPNWMAPLLPKHQFCALCGNHA